MMHSETSRPQEIDESPSHRLARVSVLSALVTLVLVGWTAWLRFDPASRPEPPAVGLALPPLRLLDLETAEPLVLLGAKGKVTWIVFWSAGSPSGRASLSKLEGVWKRLKSHRRFTMVTAAINSDQPERVRAALAEIHATVPAYLAGPETLRRFGAELADPPLHLLVDGEGRIAALVRGAGQDAINRLAAQVQSWLEEMDPLGNGLLPIPWSSDNGSYLFVDSVDEGSGGSSSIGTYLSQVAENSAGVRYSRELCGRSVLLIDAQRT